MKALKLAAAAALAFAAVGTSLPRPAQAADVTLTYAFFAPAATFPAKQMDHWVSEVSKRTDGKVKVQTFPGGTLLGAKDMYDGVSQGVADIGLGAPTYDPGRFPLSAGASLPLGFPNATVASLTYWDLMQEMKPKEFAQFEVIALFTSEPAHIMSRKPAGSFAEVKGMKLRGAGSGVQVLERLGAAPVGMPMPAVPEAVQTGVIDGLATSREVLKDFKLAENLNYVTDYPMGVVTFAAVMDKKRWSRLPADVQKTIKDLGREMALWTGQYHDKQVQTSLEWSKEKHGLKTISLPADEAAVWDQRLEPTVDEWKKNAKAQGLPADKFLSRLHELKDKYSKEYQ
jgi:TRAP-type C4-dicarboxylate transport system substrate-binding protein